MHFMIGFFLNNYCSPILQCIEKFKKKKKKGRNPVSDILVTIINSTFSHCITGTNLVKLEDV